MFLKSMTGFASHQYQLPAGQLNISVRAVNCRFLEINFTLDELIKPLESELQKLLKQVVQRGKVEITMNFVPDRTESMTLNAQLLEQLVGNIETLHDRLPYGQVDLMQLLNFPGMIQSTAIPLTPELKSAVLESFKLILEQFDAMRQHEGHNLGQVILDKLSSFDKLLASIKSQLSQLTSLEREHLLSKIQALQLTISEKRIEQEVALLAQKNDIAEEFDRLCTHTKTLRELINTPLEVNGKRLDFISQELLRESNTMAAKSSSLFINNVAVEFKLLSEQIREQVQNIE